MRRTEVSPAFVGSLALHGAVIAAVILSWGLARDLKVGAAVPVTIVSNAPDVDVRPAEQAPQEQTAQTDQPVPEAPPQAAPPPPQPAPAPVPTPAPAPTPKPPKPVEKAAPQKAEAPPKPQKSLDLDALAASLSKAARPSSAARGAPRPETALQARNTAGTGLSALAMSGLASELQRRWNPNCNVEGGRDVVVRVVFELGSGGQVVGQPSAQVVRGPAGAVSSAAADRAVRAVFAAAPFRNLPPEFYGERIKVNFDAHEACS